MTIINDIRACLDTHLANTTGIPTIANQNVMFEPTNGTPFVKATLVPVTRRPVVMGNNPQQRYSGLYSLLICTPQGLGSGAGYDFADMILDRFNAATHILYTSPTDTLLLENNDVLSLETGEGILSGNPTIVSIEYSEVGTSYLDSPFYCTPVTVSWFTHY